jgi:ribosome-associated translation inhibitor RaiA
MSINYIFRYHGSSEEIYKNSKALFEEAIINKLSDLEQQNKIMIKAFHFTFDYEKSHDTKYKLDVTIDSPNIDFAHTESDKDPLVIIHKSIDAIIRYVHKAKAKEVK